jgi:hypothetical protein
MRALRIHGRAVAFSPRLPLAWPLRAAGHEVQVSTQPPTIADMAETGLPAAEVGGGYDRSGGRDTRALSEQIHAQPSPVPLVPILEPLVGWFSSCRQRSFRLSLVDCRW